MNNVCLPVFISFIVDKIADSRNKQKSCFLLIL